MFAQGRRGADASFVVIAAPGRHASARLGLAISKKRARKAVARNRLKRLVRESFRRHAAALPALDIVVLARSGTADNDNARLAASLADHWRRLARA